MAHLFGRERRKKHIRRKIKGTSSRPRLAVYRSNKHIYAQIIDDTQSRSLVSCSTLDKELRSNLKKSWILESAGKVGEELAKRAREKGIKEVVFDRSGYKYHGKVKALAEGARKGGLKF